MPPRLTRSTTRNATKTNEDSAPNVPPAMADSTMSMALQEAIDTMPGHRLRAKMKHFCEYMPLLRHEMEEEFVVSESMIYGTAIDIDENSNRRKRTGGFAGISKRRKLEQTPKEVPRWAKCRNCKGDFDVTKNAMGVCVWHPGVKEVTHENDFWDDFEESVGGAYATLVDEPDYEDGFVWSCCEKAITEEGCKKGKHINIKNS